MPVRHPRAIPKKPQGQVTRGKTASNRLRRVDNFLIQYAPDLITRTDGDFARAFFVDLGYGAEATTTLEAAARLRRLNPALPVLGVEIDPQRVAAALPHADAQTHFRLGGFNLPLLPAERVKIIRAFNVLRQYEEAGFAPAYAQLATYVLPGGLMIEGTSDPFGRIWVANVSRKTDSGPGWDWEALVFSTNFRLGFDPSNFQAVLPKNLIHHVTPGESVHTFFEDWKRAAAASIHHKAWGLRQWFGAAARQLAHQGYALDTRTKWLDKGCLVWKKMRQP